MMLLLAIASLVSGTDKMPDRLPGSDVSVAEAERRALYIVEAKFLRLGERGEARGGGPAYPRAVIEPSKVLKGPEGTARALRQVGLLLKEDETAPEVGEVYTLYIYNANRGSYVFKVTRRPKGDSS